MNSTDESPEATQDQPEIWGGGCECWVTPEKYWVSAFSCGYGSGYEPGSQIEYNPDCPKHGDACTCEHYVVDYSDPERYHPENVDREDDPDCPIHGGVDD